MTATPLIPYNRLLTALTNRTGNFAWAAFNAPVPGFTPSTDKLTGRLRQKLNLHKGGDDFAVVLAIGNLQAHPFMHRLLQDDTKTYRLDSHALVPFTTFGGELTASSVTGPPAVLRTPSEWPVRTDMSLSFVDAHTAKLEYAGLPAFIHVETVADGRLQPEWPEACGIRGLVRLSEGSVWESGASVRWEHWPCSPQAGVLAALCNTDDAQAVISKAGAAAIYGQLQTESEKFACVCLSLALLNDKVYTRA